MEKAPKDVVPFLGADRVNVTNAIRLAAVLPTDDDNERALENIPEADQPPPLQGQLEENKICDRKATGVADTSASARIPRELPITLFLPFELRCFESFAVAVLLPLINKKIAQGEMVTHDKTWDGSGYGC